VSFLRVGDPLIVWLRVLRVASDTAFWNTFNLKQGAGWHF